MKHILSSLLFFALVGCQHRATRTCVEAKPLQQFDAWAVSLTPVEASELSGDEAKAIVVARAAIEQQAKDRNAEAPKILKLIARRTNAGFDVHVEYVGYTYRGAVGGAPGFFSSVRIDRDWNVTAIVGGA